MVSLCRLCAALKKPDLLIAINDQSEICQKLQKCCQLYIQIQDNLPKSVCIECLECLNSFYKFFTKVQEAQETLQAFYPSPSTENLKNNDERRRLLVEDHKNDRVKYVEKGQDSNIKVENDVPSHLLTGNAASDDNDTPTPAGNEAEGSSSSALKNGLTPIREHTAGEEYKNKRTKKTSSSKVKTENEVLGTSQHREIDDCTENTITFTITTAASQSEDDNDNDHQSPPVGNETERTSALKGGLTLITKVPSVKKRKHKRTKKVPESKVKIEKEMLSKHGAVEERYTENKNSFKATTSLSEEVNDNEGYLEEVYNLLGMTKDNVSEVRSHLVDVTREEEHHVEAEEVEHHIEVETVGNDIEVPLVESEEVPLVEREIEEELLIQEEFEEAEEEEYESFEIEERDQIKDFSTLPPQLQLSAWNSYTYLCYACEYSASNLSDIFVHAKSIHSVENVSQIHYKCYDCQQLLVHYSAFLNHVRLRHHPALKLRCDACDMLCSDYEKYENHRNVICSEANKYPDVLPCRYCVKNFHSSTGLQTHTRQQHHTKQDKEKYQCTECNKEFAWKRSLKNHEITHTQKREYACEFCDKLFFNKSNLESHLYTHSSEKCFKCHICQKSFKTGTILAKHQTLHTNNKPFKCSFCPKQFRSKIEQTTHERVHTGEMPLQCNHCEKRFRFRSALTAHLKVHSGVKEHACKYCPKTFRDLSNFKKHIRRKHSDKEQI